MLWLREIVEGGQFPSLKSKPEIPLPQKTLMELLDAINQLKTDGIDASQIESDSAYSEHRFLMANPDFIRIYETYNERLGNLWNDSADVHRAVANRLAEEANRGTQLMSKGFPDVDLVVAEGMDASAGAHPSILEGIARVPELVMYVTFDWDTQNNTLYEHVEQSYTRFLELGFHEVDQSESQPSRNTALTLHISRNLFRKPRCGQPPVKKLNLADRITLLKPGDRVKEVEAVAEVIKGRMLDRCSSSQHRICLSYYNLDLYASLIHEIFPIYGIPYNLDEATPLSTSPFAVSLFSLLDEIEKNVSVPSEDAFRTPYVTIENLPQFAADCRFDSQMLPGEFRHSVARLIRISRIRQQILDQEGPNLFEDHPFTVERDIGAFASLQSIIAELVEFLISHHGEEQSHALRSYINRLRFMTSQSTYHQESPTDSGFLCFLSHKPEA